MEPIVLSSWKEIAAYFNKGVRTVQRWERELGLPVRRPSGVDRQIILAVPSELDAWQRQRASLRHVTSSPGARTAPVREAHKKVHELQAKISRAMEETRRLVLRAENMKSETLKGRAGANDTPSDDRRSEDGLADPPGKRTKAA